MLVRKKEICDRIQVDFSACCHCKNMPICFGLFNHSENFTILLDQLLTLFSFSIYQCFLCIQDSIALRVTAVFCMICVHVGPRVDFSELHLCKGKVCMRIGYIWYVHHLLVWVGLRGIRHACLSIEFCVISCHVDGLIRVIQKRLSVTQESVALLSLDRSRTRLGWIVILVFIETFKSGPWWILLERLLWRHRGSHGAPNALCLACLLPACARGRPWWNARLPLNSLQFLLKRLFFNKGVSIVRGGWVSCFWWLLDRIWG